MWRANPSNRSFDRGRATPIRRSVALAGLFLTLLAIGSCTEPSPTVPTYSLGALEGYVRSAGRGISIAVEARSRDRSDVRASTTSDSTGWYRLELPTGPYYVGVHPDTSYVDSWLEVDTLTVLPRVLRRDLIRGRAEIVIAMPDEVEGREFELQLSRNQRGRAWDYQEVRGGSLSFVFPTLQTGSYTGTLESRDWRFEGEVALSDSVIVGADAVARRAANFRGSYASVSGRITGSWLQASDIQARVEALSTGSPVVASCPCEIDGAFRIDLLVPQPVRLRTVMNGVAQWIGGDSFDTATVYDPQPGERITGVEFVESGIEVLLQGPGYVVVQGSRLLVRGETDDLMLSLYTNPGYLGNLRPGRYYVRADGGCNQPLAPRWYGDTESFEAAIPIDLAPGELRRIVINLIEGGRVAGTLLTADGQPARQVDIRLTDADGHDLCWAYSAADDGSFSFTGLADGDYHLATWVHGNETWWYPGTSDPEMAAAVTIFDHRPITGLSWQLPPGGKEARP